MFNKELQEILKSLPEDAEIVVVKGEASMSWGDHPCPTMDYSQEPIDGSNVTFDNRGNRVIITPYY